MKTTIPFTIASAACALVVGVVFVGAGPRAGVLAAGRQSPAITFATQLSDAYAEIAGRLEASVVSIDVTAQVRRVRRSRDALRETTAAGSGFIIDADGYVLTNNHVVEDAANIVVRLNDGTPLAATIVGVDPETDLALLQVTSPQPLAASAFGSSDDVLPGHLVLALGSPFGFTNSVSAGIVSANGRVISQERSSQTYIQTDAAIHPGNSGGPLVNMAGEVIGVNTAVVSDDRFGPGLGFAVPSNVASHVAGHLRANGRVIRGSIGITFDTDSPAEGRGAIVFDVVPGGPASLAGIRDGDVILAVGEEVVGDGRLLGAMIERQAIGSTVAFRVLRGGGEMTLDVGIADRAVLYPNTRRGALQPFGVFR